MASDSDKNYNDSEEFVIELGDHIAINTARYGVVRGKVYYRDMDLIRIMPDGVSDRLYDFPLIDGEFDPELGFKTAAWISKNPLPGFVEQQDLQVGQYFETFTADGQLGAIFKIDKVDVNDDIIVATDESGSEIEIEFGYIGIPLDLPFAVMRVREAPASVSTPVQDNSVSIRIDADNEAALDSGVPAEDIRAMEEQTRVAAAIQDALDDGESAVAAVGDDEDLEIELVGLITLPEIEQQTVSRPEQRIYPNSMQKQDALQDFTSFLTARQLQDTKQLRKIRQLTETIDALKMDLIKYNIDGTFDTIKPQSASFINELMAMTHVPLRRPVLDVQLRVFEFVTDKFEWSLDPDTVVNKRNQRAIETYMGSDQYSNVTWDEVNRIVNKSTENLRPEIIHSFKSSLEINDFNEFINNVGTRIELNQMDYDPIMGGGPNKPNYWQLENMFYRNFGRPWTPRGEITEQDFIARRDSEFFRQEIPELEFKAVEGLEPAALIRGKPDPSSMSIGKVNYSLRRALGPTYKKIIAKSGGKSILINAEEAVVKSDILFPLRFKRDLGTTRSGLILNDYLYSHMIPLTMTDILKTAGSITEVPQGNSILAIGVDGNTLGNIKVSDFIDNVNVKGLGPGHISQELSNYGINSLEMNIELADVVMKKAQHNINAIKNYIKKLREELAQIQAMPPEVITDNFITDIKNWLLDKIVTDDHILNDLLMKFKNQSAVLSKSENVIISYLYVNEPDLLLSSAGQQAEQVAKEKRNANIRHQLKLVKQLLQKKKKEAEAGLEPKPNTCEHVAALDAVNAIDDAAERMYYKGKFMIRYQGERKDNWIKCSVCARDLMCVHEVIEIHQFNRPAEREVLRKELLLNFCGPVQGRHYNCRNCGQSLGEIEYDNNIQFDDEGRPMMGRAEIIDKDALLKDQLEQVFNPIPQEKAKVDFGNEKKNRLYYTIKELSDRVAINLTNSDFEILIRMIHAAITEYPTREQYIANAQLQQPGRKIPDYDVAVERNVVFNTCAYLLIFIQTHIPEYMPSMVLHGCKNPGFSGFPLSSDEQELQGLEYISCAAASIMINEAPWNMTGFQKEVDSKRMKMIMTYTLIKLKGIIESNPEVQQMIVTKRKYLKELFGAGAEGIEGVIHDEIGPFFLPRQKIVSASDASEKGTVIIPEVNTHMTIGARANIWIQKANIIAEEEGKTSNDIIIGSPFAEATTCYSAIYRPRNFWKNPDLRLPDLPPRFLELGALVSRLNVRFVPRELKSIIPSAPTNIYYKLFLNVCWQGPRKGLPHEFGYNHRCPHCGFIKTPFETMPQDIVIDKGDYRKHAKDIEKYLEDFSNFTLSLFETQGIQVNTETFQDLLDATHNNYSVIPYKRGESKSSFDALREVALLDPPPTNGWPAIMERTIVGLSSLPPDAGIADILEALDDLSQLGPNALAKIAEERFSKKSNAINYLQDLLTLDPSEIGEALLSHFILPMERLINYVDPFVFTKLPRELINPSGSVQISKKHQEDLTNLILENNLIVKTFYSDFAPGRNMLARAKIQYFIQQISQIPPLLGKININKLIGGERTFKYLIQALVYCPLLTLLDPNVLPSPAYRQDAISAMGDTSLSIVHNIVSACLKVYYDNKMIYSNEHIQEALQIRIEKEEQRMLDEYNKLTDEQKLMKKQRQMYGVGEYAITEAAVRRYDPQRYDIEFQERDEANIGSWNFNLQNPDYELVPKGRFIDPESDGIFGNDDVGQGYDVAQQDDDDY